VHTQRRAGSAHKPHANTGDISCSLQPLLVVAGRGRPTRATIEGADAAQLIPILNEFGAANAALAKACLNGLFCRISDEIAGASDHSALAWASPAFGIGLPFVSVVTKAMHAHPDLGRDEGHGIAATGVMTLTPLVMDASAPRTACLMAARAVVATLLPVLPFTMANTTAANDGLPSVMLLLGMVVQHGGVLLQAGALEVFHRLRDSCLPPERTGRGASSGVGQTSGSIQLQAEVAIELLMEVYNSFTEDHGSLSDSLHAHGVTDFADLHTPVGDLAQVEAQATRFRATSIGSSIEDID
jgi:hypothetical protein